MAPLSNASVVNSIANTFNGSALYEGTIVPKDAGMCMGCDCVIV